MCRSKTWTVYRGVMCRIILNIKDMPAEVKVTTLWTYGVPAAWKSNSLTTVRGDSVILQQQGHHARGAVHTTRSSSLTPSAQWVCRLSWAVFLRPDHQSSYSSPFYPEAFSVNTSSASRRGWGLGHSFHSLCSAGTPTLASAFLSQKWWHPSTSCHRAASPVLQHTQGDAPPPACHRAGSLDL